MRKKKEPRRYRNNGPVLLGPWTISLQIFDPELAQYELDKMGKNRALRKSSISHMVQDMSSNKWHLTPQGIIFNEDNILIDGQHRLTAIVKSGIPQELMVTRNNPRVNQPFIDLTNKRTTKDVYTLDSNSHGRYANKLVTVSRFTLFGPKAAHAAGYQMQIRDPEVAKFIIDNEELMTSYVKAFSVADFRGVFSGGWVAAFVTAALIYGRDEIDQLVYRLSNLEWDDKKDPLRALFRFLRNKGGRTAKSSPLNNKWSRKSYLAATTGIISSLSNKKISIIRSRHNQKDFKGASLLRIELIDSLHRWYDETYSEKPWQGMVKK